MAKKTANATIKATKRQSINFLFYRKRVPELRAIVRATILLLLCSIIPAAAQDISAQMQSISGSYSGESDERIKNSLLSYGGTGICQRIITAASYELTLDVSPAGKGIGRMEIDTDYEAEYSDTDPTQENQEMCFRKSVGNPNASTGQNTITYDIEWHLFPYNKRRIALTMRGTDCSGDLCGKLGIYFRTATVYDSGDLVYDRPNSQAVRLTRN